MTREGLLGGEDGEVGEGGIGEEMGQDFGGAVVGEVSARGERVGWWEGWWHRRSIGGSG